MGAISYLAKDHPDFERIRGLLLGAREPLWLANRSWPVEEETEVWILDVRAGSAVQTKNGS
jgi:hypothetical protein